MRRGTLKLSFLICSKVSRAVKACLFESRVFIENWQWVSQGHGVYVMHTGNPWEYPSLYHPSVSFDNKVCILFVFLFVGTKPENPYFASRPGLEIKPVLNRLESFFPWPTSSWAGSSPNFFPLTMQLFLDFPVFLYAARKSRISGRKYWLGLSNSQEIAL